jgi:hypothetical protein
VAERGGKQDDERDRVAGGVPRVAPARRMLAWAAGSGVAGALYLLLIDTIDAPELYAGAAVVALAGVAFEAARERGLAEALFLPRWLARVAFAAARVPGDIVRLSISALEQLARPQPRRGEFRAVRFNAGDSDSPRDAGRRALAEAAGSLAPNTIILGIDCDRGLILAHQLRRSGGADALDPLRLR